jgi:hypothetical protein
MLWVIAWGLCLYAGIKFGHLIVGTGFGFGRGEATLSSRLRAGEPMLLIGTLSITALVAIYTTWWKHRFLEGHYTYAMDCYSKMAASHLLPGRPERFGSFDAADAATDYVWSAEMHGAQLGMRVDDIDRKLIQGRLAYSGYFARLASENARGKIAASFAGLDRCLNHEGAPKGEFLNP